MALEQIQSVTGRAVHVPGDDIDTDRIIPARFLKCVTFDGIGEHLFRDVRYNADSSKKDHPLNDPRFEGATILIADRNFGCGSSREHAPQSIAKAGFRAVIAESFAEIFFGNSTTLGIPCVSLPRDARASLVARVNADPKAPVTVDLKEQVVRAGDLALPFTIKPGARESLIRGTWDPIAQLLEGADEVAKVAARLPYVQRAAAQ
ncbi:isopropylmalate isomerase [Sorangium cellulosum]|uniref:3-isopropylmalate dehydratase n=1 Tax=Sorangium cellulosum TaxID=56 RepID=A0A2L0EHK6_SORCE|nr:3-isopropylmalate dehydratase small subunit [Sorangium cellulosum]AUX38767.1 isopropylmalate isomerase [Sorangium cellulosum]